MDSSNWICLLSTLSPNTHTKGNSLILYIYTLYTHRQCRSNYYPLRIINHWNCDWNKLLDEIVNCTSTNCFKTQIDNYIIAILTLHFCSQLSKAGLVRN